MTGASRHSRNNFSTARIAGPILVFINKKKFKTK